MNYALKCLAVGLWLSSLQACIFDNCSSCGTCSSGASESAAPAFNAPSVAVWAEPSGEIVVDVGITQFINCSETRTQSTFLRWNPNTHQLEPRSGGPSAQARRLVPTTLGGGVTSFEDAAMGLTIQSTTLFGESQLQINAVYMGATQTLTCRGGFGTALECR